MQTTTLRTAGTWASTTALLVGALFAPVVPAFAAVSGTNAAFQLQGANIQSFSSTQFASASFYQTLKNLKADNANAVTFVIPLLQSSKTSADVHTLGSTPTDQALITAITEAHSLGLTVTLKPHDEVSTGEWRAYIDPTDRAAWFASYGDQLVHYGQIAQANGVEQMVLGTELIDIASETHNASNTQNWYDLIARVRTVYSGSLGYASNWGSAPFDEMNQIKFWDKLDFIGVDLYYSYSSATESVPDMVKELNKWNENQLTPLQNKYSKPVEFTEVGYRSVVGANTQPFNWEIQGAVDTVDQANAYHALFTYWNGAPFIKGMSLWDWNPDPNYGGANNNDYTPQGKPAEAVIAAWYGGTGSNDALASALQPLQITAASSASSTAPGTSITFSTTVKNAGNYSRSNMTIDTEVYAANGTRVFQKFAQGQTIAAGGTSTYTYAWAPSIAGVYTVKNGAFSDDWSQNYIWNENAATLLVQEGVQTLPPPVPVVPGSLTLTSSNSTASVNGPATVTAQVSNGGSPLSNALVDIEVYDSNDRRVSQNFVTDQAFATGIQKQFTSVFTPIATGIYRVALGIFSNDWSHNFIWNNQAGTVKVGSTPVLTPPVSITTPPVATTTPPVATTTSPVVTPPVSTTTAPIVTPPPVVVMPPVTVSKNTGSVSGSTAARVGTSVDFGGHNFGHEESVAIVVDGQTLSTSPHADGGGNFSTGSLSVPATPGTYRYLFTGMVSGITGSIDVVVTP